MRTERVGLWPPGHPHCFIVRSRSAQREEGGPCVRRPLATALAAAVCPWGQQPHTLRLRRRGPEGLAGHVRVFTGIGRAGVSVLMADLRNSVSSEPFSWGHSLISHCRRSPVGRRPLSTAAGCVGTPRAEGAERPAPSPLRLHAAPCSVAPSAAVSRHTRHDDGAYAAAQTCVFTFLFLRASVLKQ